MDRVKQNPAEVWQGLMAAKEIVKTANISRAYLYVMLARKTFPQPVLRQGPRYTRWLASDVQAWLADPQAWISAHATGAQAVTA
jgi:predicted DNA-binding transcriptional regulator AlpA